MGHRVASAAVVGGLVVAFGAASLLPAGTTPLSAPPAAAAGLVPYDSCEPLVESFRAELRRTVTAYGWGGDFRRFAALEGIAVPEASGGAGRSSAAEDTAGAVGSGSTGTNLQEQGVDEPDIAKIADGLIVTVGQGALQVVRAGPQPRILGTLPRRADAGVDSFGYYGQGEVLLLGSLAVVLSHGYFPPPALSGADAALSYLPAPGWERTTVRLADLSTPTAPRWLEEWSIDGTYVSARLVDGTIRLVTRGAPTPVPAELREPYGPAEADAAVAANRAAVERLTADQLLPRAIHRVGDRTVQSGPALECRDVSAAPDAVGVNLLTVTTLRPAGGLAPLGSIAVQADGDLIYAAADRLFVATSRWGTAAGWADLRGPDGAASTQLHSFDTRADEVRYLGTGDVPGYVLGRWALSWHAGALRVATTEGAPWGPEPGSSSTLTVLREAGGRLVPVGSVTGLGKGEQVQAVRFLGDIATVVTFRQTDPLYVLDLADPEQPRLLGELKVPGFSTYLHPVGEDRLLGIGMEADVDTGMTTGLQASLFDLSDLSAPVQLSRLQLGEGSSEALWESRAFGYDPERRVAVMPISQYSDSEGEVNAAIGISVGADGVLTEAGKMRLAIGEYPRRVLADGERVYAVTDLGVVAGSAGFVRSGSVTFPM